MSVERSGEWSTFIMAKETKMKTTETELKAIAKATGAALKRSGHAVPHSVLLHALAAALNKRDWHVLKASLSGDVPQIAEAATPKSILATLSNRTLFLLRLAYAAGKPVALEQKTESQLVADSLAVVGQVDGLLHWVGWSLPGTLLVAESKVDAGDFRPEKPAAAGSFKMQLPHAQLEFEVGYSAEKGWYPSTHGVAVVFQQLEQQVLDADLLRGGPAFSGPSVTVSFHTDDYRFETDFDAQAFLQQASAQTLKDIFEVGFTGDICTDKIAEYMADKGLNETISEAFTYLDALNKALSRAHGDSVGFECKVDGEDYLNWMAVHRTPLLASMLCEYFEVDLVQAQEEEIYGMWDWLDRDSSQACDCSFESQEEAEMDAYVSLSLLQRAIDELT